MSLDTQAMPSSSANATEPVAASGRRTFLRFSAGLLGSIAAFCVGLPFVGYLLQSRKQAPQWVQLGKVSEFPPNETRQVDFDNPLRQPWDGIVAHTGVYVRNEGKDDQKKPQFLVLAVNCAHLGCPVSWFPASALFMCPCHGGVYYSDGSRASGPPPRGLYACVWRIRQGKLEIQAPHYPTLQDTLKDKA